LANECSIPQLFFRVLLVGVEVWLAGEVLTGHFGLNNLSSLFFGDFYVNMGQRLVCQPSSMGREATGSNEPSH